MERRRKAGLSLSAVIILMLIAAIVSGAAVYLWQNLELYNNKPAVIGDQDSISPVLRKSMRPWTGAA